jgi:hypothetical protein
MNKSKENPWKFPVSSRGISFPTASTETCFGATPSFLFRGTWGSFLGWSDRGVKVTTHFHPVPTFRMMAIYLHSPICLHGMYSDFAFTFCTLPLPVTHRFVMSLSTPYTADGTSVFHVLPGLCQCVLGNWCNCFSNFFFLVWECLSANAT